MKLAFSTNAFKRISLEEAIAVIARTGYGGVEIMADVPHAWPPHMPDERVAGLVKTIADYRLCVSNINAFTLFALGDTYHPSWIEKDPHRRKMRIDHTLACIRLAAKLGARTMSLEPGGPLSDMNRPEALAIYEDGLRQVLPAARQAGVMLLVEPEPGLLIQTSRQCVDFLQRIAHPNLKMNCDVGHFFCVDEDPAAVLRAQRQWIAHVHLEDIAPNRVHQHLIPGHGAIDFSALFTALDEIDYDGWVTVELYPYETTAEQAAREAFDYLHRFFS